MNSKTQVKVIKKSALTFYKTSTVRKENQKRNSTREISSTVSGWVSEFQLRNKATSKTFDCLFLKN